MTASVLHSFVRRSFLPALLASCFVVVGTGCEDEDDYDSGWGRGDHGGSQKCNRRRPPPPSPADPLVCVGSATVVLRAPAALQPGVDPSTLWVRACVDDRCSDSPLPAGLPEGALDEFEQAEAAFEFPLELGELSCGPHPRLAAVSIYDTLTKAPVFTAVSEVSLVCEGPGCEVPVIEFVVPDDAFTCEARGALIRLQVNEPIALPEGAEPTATVCVDGFCSEAIVLPVTESGLGPGLNIDVMLQGVDRSSVEATAHVVDLTIGPAAEGASPYTESFELLLDPASSFACDLRRDPDFVLPLQPAMFAAPPSPGGGRPPPYEPVSGG